MLEQEYKKLQEKFHPDRVVDADDRSRLQALQQSSMVNDAYEILKTPLKRAAYLLKLNNVDAEEHNQRHLNEEFLLQQIELREALENLIANEDVDELGVLKNSVIKTNSQTQNLFELHFNNGELANAKAVYNKLQFLFKLLEEIDKAEERLLDY